MSIKEINMPQSYPEVLLETLDHFDARVDELFPDHLFQGKLDNLGRQIHAQFAPFEQFNKWLEENPYQDFFRQFASYLIKLPARSARNILVAFYGVLSGAAYLSVHPVKGMSHLVRNSVKLSQYLSSSENWSKLGGGTIGLLAGQSLVLGNPVSLMGMAVGGALVSAGITLDAFKAAYQAESGDELVSFRKSVEGNVNKALDAAAVSLFTGMFLGAIRQMEEETMHIWTKKHTYTKVDNVAQYGWGDWSGFIKKVSNVTLEEAKAIADADSKINYFFYMKGWSMYIGPGMHFQHGDAVFFSGKPWWGSAWGFSDGYIKG